MPLSEQCRPTLSARRQERGSKIPTREPAAFVTSEPNEISARESTTVIWRCSGGARGGIKSAKS